MNIPSSVFLMYASLAEKPVTSVRGYSGISITKDWVLAHGSALAPILARSRLLLEFVSTLNPGVLTPFPTKESDLLIHREISLDSDSALESTRDTRLQTETTTGKLAALWQCPLLRQTLDRSFESWTFETSKDHFDRLLLPVFLLIERRSNRREDEKGHGEGALSLVRRIEEALSLLVECTVGSILTRGAVVEIVSTPFGNPLFVNSVTRGIVGNLFGTNDCLFLTDANALPGCEGGLVHVIVNRDCKVICGMVIACMSWCRGEWVDYTFAANLLPSLKRILSKQQVSLRQEGHNATRTSRICEDRGHDCGHGHDKEQCYYHDQLLRSYQNLLSGATPTSTETLERSVVVVTCGPSWGTAILIDEGTGIFVTCAHVVSRAPEMEICLTSRITACADKSQWFARARLVYKTPLNKPYDIAILRIDPDCSNPSLRAIKLAKKPARKGEQVLSVGFPFSSKNSATFSSGVVSRTVKCMLQTSCCAQNGTSGGPILRRNSHEMLGMLVCNAASSNGSMSYPRLSMAIPVTVFAGSLAEYLRTTDPGVLETLTEVDITVQRIWKLRPVLFSNM